MQVNSEKNITRDGENLREWLNTIPYGNYNKVVGELLDSCFITREILKNWWMGRTRIPELAKNQINLIAQKYSGHEIF